MDPLLTLFAAIIALAWAGLDAMRAKEAARRAAHDACARAGVYLLDDTVQRQRLWLCRDGSGRLRLCRRYGFEFTSDGAQRYAGSLQLTGHRAHTIQLDAYRI